MSSEGPNAVNRALVMQNVIKAALVALVIALAAPVAAQDFEVGFGNVETQFVLGNKYGEGRGVTLDHAKAVRWSRMAADQGHAETQIKLGDLP